MFGRRRRTAPASPVQVAPAPAELSNAQVFEHLHSALADLIGVEGAWTLVPRSDEDTDAIFHGLKAEQVAATLTAVLARETVTLRTDTALAPANVAEPRTDTPADGITAVGPGVSTGALLVTSGAEPTALPWNPAPISVWAETQGAGRPVADRTVHLVA